MTKSVKFANFVLISGIIICITMFLYAFSKSDSHPPGSIYIYYYISITVSVVLLAVLYRCKDKTKVNIALFFFSIVMSIYLIEFSLLLYGLMPKHLNIPVKLNTKPINLAENKRLPVDSRSKFQITMDLRKNDIKAYPHVFPFSHIGTDGLDYKGTKLYPLGAISNSTTIFCNEEIGPVIYETDEHGFRNPKGQYDLKVGSLDVALIGDSFAQGHCVKNGEDIAGQLRKNNRNVLNLGMEGSGPLIELGILSEYAKPFQPKYVFWLYWEGNDMPNLSWEKAPTLIKYLDKSFSQNLVSRQDLIDNALIADIEKRIANKGNHYNVKKSKSIIPIIKYNIKRVIKLHHLRSNLRSILGLNEHCLFKIDPMFNDILTQAKRRVEDWSGQLYFVYLPANGRYQGNICSKSMYRSQREKIISLVKELNINVMDIAEHFDSHSDPLSLFYGHYNSKGYGLVAQKIEERLE